MPKAKVWIEAIRPKTLPAGLVPVCIGASYSFSQGKFDLSIFLVILFCSLMIQIITNFFNEVYDFKRGADSNDRLGPTRGVSTGAISLKTMWLIIVICIIITFLSGLYLVSYSNLNILYIGLISLFMSWLYTGGPYPLAYVGLGDLFVLIFFGFAATSGTFYVFHQEINNTVLVLSLIPGITSMNILAINNIRDIAGDRLVRKMTLPARLGALPSKIMYLVLATLTYFVILYLIELTGNSTLYYNFITTPLYLFIIIQLFKVKGKKLNKLLALNGLLLLLLGLFTSLAFIYE